MASWQALLERYDQLACSQQFGWAITDRTYYVEDVTTLRYVTFGAEPTAGVVRDERGEQGEVTGFLLVV
jgi:hypothetical protein